MTVTLLKCGELKELVKQYSMISLYYERLHNTVIDIVLHSRLTSDQTPAFCADQRLVVNDHSQLHSTTAQHRLPSLYVERYTHRAMGWTRHPQERATSAVHSHFL